MGTACSRTSNVKGSQCTLTDRRYVERGRELERDEEVLRASVIAQWRQRIKSHVADAFPFTPRRIRAQNFDVLPRCQDNRQGGVQTTAGGSRRRGRMESAGDRFTNISGALPFDHSRCVWIVLNGLVIAVEVNWLTTVHPGGPWPIRRFAETLRQSDDSHAEGHSGNADDADHSEPIDDDDSPLADAATTFNRIHSGTAKRLLSAHAAVLGRMLDPRAVCE